MRQPHLVRSDVERVRVGAPRAQGTDSDEVGGYPNADLRERVPGGFGEPFEVNLGGRVEMETVTTAVSCVDASSCCNWAGPSADGSVTAGDKFEPVSALAELVIEAAL